MFRHDEFVAAHAGDARWDPITTATYFARRVADGDVVRVAHALYATVPEGVAPDELAVDPFLLATRLTKDAVVAYHAALEFHGVARTGWRLFHYLAEVPRPALAFRGIEWVRVGVPARVRSLPDRGGGVAEYDHRGGIARVTTLERTLVDALDEARRCGGWEDVWRSLANIRSLDLDAVVEQALARDQALTAARVGLFLDTHRARLGVAERHLAALRERAPRRPAYIDARHWPGRLDPAWNLIVPDFLRALP